MILNYSEFLKENTNNNIEFYFDNLRKNHSKSPYVEIWISKIESLLKGDIDFIYRTDFRKPMGEQFGLEFIDSLIVVGILNLEKVGRKETITISKIDNKFIKDLDKLKKELGCLVEFNKNTLTISKNYLSNIEYTELPNVWYDNAKEIAEEFMLKYFSKIEKSYKDLDFSKSKLINRYTSNDFVAQYEIKIKGITKK